MMTLRSVLVSTMTVLLCVNVWAKKIEVSDDTAAEVKTPKSASTGNDLRKMRRVGLGVTAAGPLGMGGLHVELNFTPRSGIIAGYGGGPGYQAYTFQYKYVLAGEWLLPYMGVGVSRWANFERKGTIKETTPGILAERFMSDEEKARGEISETLLYPAFGLQYVQLDGRWAGFSVFTELVVLFDVGDFVAAPTGTLGMIYYF